MGVQSDGTAFRGAENQQEFLVDPPVGVQQPFIQQQPQPGPSHAQPQPDADEEDEQEADAVDEGPPNRLVSKASEDPAEPSEEQPEPPEEKEPELSQEFVSASLDAIQKVLNLEDIIVQEDKNEIFLGRQTDIQTEYR